MVLPFLSRCRTAFRVIRHLPIFLSTTTSATGPVVDILGLGSVSGIVSDLYPSVSRFFAIPYAQPPVGELRWASPKPHGPFKSLSPLNGTYPGPCCIQPTGMGMAFDPAAGNNPNVKGPDGQVLPMEESCLTLDVAVPSEPAIALDADGAIVPSRGLPVMVWFHGGGFSVGAGAPYRSDALVHASKGAVIVVTVNFRLGVFGFLGSAELQARGRVDGEQHLASTGNYGIEDQRLALKWVREHIGAFGGDPRAVTIFGESSGGGSVLQHLVQPASAGLFHRAIIQSGTAYMGGKKTLADAEITYQKVLQNTGCNDVQELVDMDAHTLAAAYPEGNSQPTVDNVELMDDPAALVATGAFDRRVPLIIGHCRHEFGLNMMMAWFGQSAPAPDEFSEEAYDKLWRQLELDDSMVIRGQALHDEGAFAYPRGGLVWAPNKQEPTAREVVATASWWKAVGMLNNEDWSHSHYSVRRAARLFLAGGAPAVYTYRFDHAPQRDELDGSIGWDCCWFEGNTACRHAADLPYTFGGALQVMPGEEAALALRMAKMWTTFAVTGQPADEAREWPAYVAGDHAPLGEMFLALDVESAGGVRPVRSPEGAQCDFWDDVRVAREIAREGGASF